MPTNDDSLISDETARDAVRLGMLALVFGMVFWIAVITALVVVIIHFT